MAIALDGSEQLEVVQAGVSKRTTTSAVGNTGQATVLADLAAPTGASRIGLTQGGNVQQGLRVITPDMKGAVSGVNSDTAMTTWSNAGPLLGLQSLDYQTTTTLFPSLQDTIIDLGGGSLVNTNTTALNVNDQVVITIQPGYTNLGSDDALTKYTVVSVSGVNITLGGTDASNFTVGAMIYIRGNSQYIQTVGADTNTVPTYVTRARVEAINGSVLTLDRGLPPGMEADTPLRIGNYNTAGRAVSYIAQNGFLAYRPVLMNGVIKSNIGNPMTGGGSVDALFFNLTFSGRNLQSLNACQDALFLKLRGVGNWRKLTELAGGSIGTSLYNVRGTLIDGSTKNGGGSDVGPFGLAFGENSQYNLWFDYNVSSGVNNFGASISAIISGSGRHNSAFQGFFNFPAHTGYGIGVQSNATAGNPNNDTTFQNTTMFLPVGNRFINVSDGGGGLTRPVFRFGKYFGTVSSGYAVNIAGSTEGTLQGNWFESGTLRTSTSFSNWNIFNNYFPAGFDGSISDAIFQTNNIYNNDSAANRAANQAALQYWSGPAGDTITTTVANAVYKSATFPAGSLKAQDTIIAYADFAAAGTGAAARNVRISVTDGASVTTGMGSTNATTNGPLAIRSSIIILSNTVIRFQTQIFTPTGVVNVNSFVTVADISTNPLTINLEAWCAVGTTPSIIASFCEILPRKRGFLPIMSMA